MTVATGLPILPASECAVACAPSSTADALNRDCFCLGVDQPALRAELETLLGVHGLPGALVDSHPHLFSSLPVFVSPGHLALTAAVVSALQEVVALPAYRSAVLARAPTIAAFDPGPPGGLLGLDFHLGPQGPRLIVCPS